ncbi:MAG: DUF58 domain-containing protein [Bifidobacteriaceae bacterium]|jgi:uncharacterized protein (DUF58 family)|nr:DUF58 domain-containing protein [Bifidobacteriaceae bacterium]
MAGQSGWDRYGLARGAFGLAFLGAGLLLGQPGLGLVGVPILVAFGWALAWPSADRLTLDLAVETNPAGAGQPAGRVTARLEPGTTPGVDLVRLRLAAPGHRLTEVWVTPGQALQVEYRSVRTGLQPSLQADFAGLGPFGLLTQAPDQVEGPQWLTLPQARTLEAVPVPAALRGLTGPRRSTRRGEGLELHDIAPHGPGARRIDWRTTAKRGGLEPGLETLYGRRTLASSEAVAVLVIDSRDNLGPDSHTWSGHNDVSARDATSLDLARHAAASVATALIEAGDRVGFEDLGRRRRSLPPAAGRRHLRRLLHSLALAAPAGEKPVSSNIWEGVKPQALGLGGPAGEAQPRIRPPQVAAGAIVYLFTTLADDESLRLVRAWLEGGHRVVVVDTLPGIRPMGELSLRLAWRMLRLERHDRAAALMAHGVPVVRVAAVLDVDRLASWFWVGPPPKGTRQADMSRQLAAAARAAARGRPMTSIKGGGIR